MIRLSFCVALIGRQPRSNPRWPESLSDSEKVHIRMSTRTRLAGAALGVALLGLVACGGATATTTGANAVQSASTAATAPAASTTKVNANTATRAQLQAAFEAAGIPGAARWAGEVEEYRPYATNDPNFGKLRKELAKY